MARTTRPLSVKEIKAAKARDKEYKLFDGGGLFLSVRPTGSKVWRIKYRYHGKERQMALGAYPRISLSQARDMREEVRAQVYRGIDPVAERRAAQAPVVDPSEWTVQRVGEAWLESYVGEVSEGYHRTMRRRLEMHVYPLIGSRPMEEIRRRDLVALLEVPVRAGLDETARRVATLLTKIYKYALTHDLVEHNIMADIDLRVVLGRPKGRHYPTFTKPEQIRGLLLSIESYEGLPGTRDAMRILPYLFVRSSNIRHMEWAEIDLPGAMWHIPAHKMKTREPFDLPLPSQVVAMLEAIRERTGGGRYVFDGIRSDGEPLSDNTLISALRRMGYTKEEFVPHSFRAMFATVAYEYANRPDGHGYTGEVIEACLAHKEPNKIKAAYNRSTYREAMRGLMQWYADWLDGVRTIVAPGQRAR